MTNADIIKRLSMIKSGIESDRFTMENIDHLISDIKKADYKALADLMEA